MFQRFLNLFRPLPDENVPRIRELFSFLIEDYGFSFVAEDLGDAVDRDGKFFFYGPLKAYCIYNESVCINILYLEQRQDYEIFITDSYKSDQVYIRNGARIDDFFAYHLDRYADELRSSIAECGEICGRKIAATAERMPDVEVVITFNGVRRTPARSGYRPAHDLGGGRVLGGIHHYFDVDEVAPDGKARGTIAFFTPEALAASIQCGMQFPIQEGARIVGMATVVKILNPVLKQK